MASRDRQPPPPKPRRPLRWLLYVALAFVLLVIGALVMYALVQRPPSDLEALASAAHSFKLFGVAVQTALVVWVAVAWHAIVDAGRRRGIVARHEYERVLALRWPVFAVLVAYLLLVPIGPATIYRFIVH